MNSPRDVAAFRLPRLSTSAALHLAARPPAVGDTIWLFARLRGETAPPSLMHPATLVWMDSTGILVYVFHETLSVPDDLRRREAERLSADSGMPETIRTNAYRSAGYFRLIYTSGAPVLDARGAVVGMHVASALVAEAHADSDSALAHCCAGWPDDQFLGIAVPADSIRTLIRYALSRRRSGAPKELRPN